MHLLAFSTVAALISEALCTDQSSIVSTTPSLSQLNNQDIHRIAIIGSGIAGASAALFLSQSSTSKKINITIYESGMQAGGRAKTELLFGRNGVDIEVGAQDFSLDDWCIMKSIAKVGLQTKAVPSPKKSVAVWDGNNFINFGQATVGTSILDITGLATSTYHLDGPSIQRLVNSSWAQFQNVGSGISDILQDFQDELSSELEKVDQALNGVITPSFLEEVFGPVCRSRYGQAPADLRGITALLVSENNVRQSVTGGNQGMVKAMITSSGARLLLGTKVDTITVGSNRRYAVQAAEKYDEYDTVIIAAPIVASGITIDKSISSKKITPVNYTSIHVTYFTTPDRMSPTFFNKTSGTILPDDVLTTVRGSQTAGFISFTTVNEVCNSQNCPTEQPCEQCDFQYLYKILSTTAVPDSAIASILGQIYIPGTKMGYYGVTWVYRQFWPYNAPQYSDPGSVLGLSEVASHLFYTGGSESIYPSLETSCRAGYNIAMKFKKM